MDKARIYISTTASDAHNVAMQNGLGIEIAEYCTAWNMDDKFSQVHPKVLEAIDGITYRVLHAPFNELFPCAIDLKARELAAERYRQAIRLAKDYGATKVIIHGGYNPWIYYPVWYVEQSILFWKEFLQEDPGVEIVLENVLETQPQWLLDIVKSVDHPKLKLCLDVGHVNAYSDIPVAEWMESWAPYISHFHVHNNDGTQDQHNGLTDGTIDMKELFAGIRTLCPDATVTLELIESKESVQWLMEEELWNC